MPAEALAVQTKIWKSTASTAADQAYEIRTIDDLPPTGTANDVYQSFGTYPLIFSNRSIGVLKLLSHRKDFFTEDKRVLIQSYANLGAVAIQNAWLFDEVQQSNRQLHALSQRLMKAQEEERLHLSRELHDESGQLLAGLTVQVGLLDRDADHPEMIHERVAELKNTANAIQANLHRLAVNLRPASLDHLGLVTALEQLVREFSRQYCINVEFETVGMQQERLPIEIETALFRIVQESLTNVVLHAQATQVDVLLSMTNKGLSAVIEDNGIGFSHVSSLSDEQLGLFGMRERVKMLGGTFTIESSPGKGTMVKAEVPCHD
jgi:signal transduction histidine kinase